MNVAKWVILAVLALPILELIVFIAVAAAIGFGWALSLILAGSLCGVFIVRRAGGGHIAGVRMTLAEGPITALQTDARGSLVLLAGILLLIPGFITDIVALLLLIEPLRRAFVGTSRQTENGTIDLPPERWHRVPDPILPDRRTGGRDC